MLPCLAHTALVRPWTDDVIARYLTRGFAALDFTARPHGPEGIGVQWTCTGCDTRAEYFDLPAPYYTAHVDAQAHAESCSRVAKPSQS
ncbi:hypothetical protein ACIP5N_31950 [Streptomyces sp. NPDC088768]|uniref:hypothetical protein n=1 Tax=Streptomyces sp. NPDC088768 TaxID=3365894 RepID=UPI00380CC185